MVRSTGMRTGRAMGRRGIREGFGGKTRRKGTIKEDVDVDGMIMLKRI
jgi:hypothetical protein